MPSNFLRRTYVIRGLDRILYSRHPAWSEGTFLQDEEDVGRLVLLKEGIPSPGALRQEIALMDSRAKRFCLAVSKRAVRPLTMKLERSEEPNFERDGLVSLRSAAQFSEELHAPAAPREPPAEMEQISEVAERWIATLAETANFGDYPDEVLKRLYLLIEEFKDGYTPSMPEEAQLLEESKLLRNFVSHPICKDDKVVAFVGAHLPQAAISANPPQVRFDRTDIDHRNFVGRFEPKIRKMALNMLNAEIEKLTNPNRVSGSPDRR